MDKQEIMKRAVAKKAATLVEDGMLVGLGTGSTANYFIEELIKRCREGLSITAVSSSTGSAELAKAGKIPIIDMEEVISIDLTVDGADQLDSQNCMIKGGGGALFREKIIASTSKKIIVIVDETKLVSQLGKCNLPVEILPFACKSTIYKLHQKGYPGKMRLNPNGSLFITDNKNYIFDIRLPDRYFNPIEDHERIRAITGVIETGFFFDLPLRVLVGYADGTVAFKNAD